MRTIETKIYKYSELSDSAKEAAREWYREGIVHDNWWDGVYYDFQRICKIIGVDIDYRSYQYYPYKTTNPKTATEPCIWFSHFYCQGEGACFEGHYSYGKESTKKIREYCNDKELIRIADSLYEEQRKNFYRIQCNISQSGRYHHYNCMDFDFLDGNYNSCIVEEVQCLSKWLLRSLKNEYEYLTSDEVVAESIETNEYEFDEYGNVA